MSVWGSFPLGWPVFPKQKPPTFSLGSHHSGGAGAGGEKDWTGREYFGRAQNQQAKVLLTIDLLSRLPSGELKPVH